MFFQVLDHLESGGFAQIIDIGFVGETQDADSCPVERQFDGIQGVLQKLYGVGRHAVVDFPGDFQEPMIEA